MTSGSVVGVSDSVVSYKTGLPRGEVRVQCCTWLLNLALCYCALGVVEQSVLSHVQSDTCCLKKVVVALPRLCGRLADDSLITTLGEQPVLSGSGVDRMATGLPLNRCCPVPVFTCEGPDTYRCRPALGLSWGVTFRCQGSSIWVRGGGSTVIVCRSSSVRFQKWCLLDGPVRVLRFPHCCNPARFHKRCVLDCPVRALRLSLPPPWVQNFVTVVDGVRVGSSCVVLQPNT